MRRRRDPVDDRDADMDRRVACFSSTVLHRSGAHTTDQARRVFLARYSAEPIL